MSGSPPDFVRRLYVHLENRTSGCAVFYHQTRTIWLTQPGRFRDADLLKPFWDPLTAVSKPICASKYPSLNVLNFFRTLLDYLNMYHYLGNTHVQNVCCTIFMSSNFTGQGRCLQTCVKLLVTCVLPQKRNAPWV